MAWSNLNEKMCGRPNWFGCVFFSFHKLTLKLTTSGMWTEFSTRINFKIYSISICRERKKKNWYSNRKSLQEKKSVHKNSNERNDTNRVTKTQQEEDESKTTSASGRIQWPTDCSKNTIFETMQRTQAFTANEYRFVEATHQHTSASSTRRVLV